MSFIVYPAIDVRGGRVVRLRQGDYGHQTTYADDPHALAMRYADAGARWLHLVDLDAARDGGYGLQRLLRRIVLDGRLQVQTGGGVRREADVEALLAAGAGRVLVGSLAVESPDLVAGWLARFGGERLTIALDASRLADGSWRPMTRGWTATGSTTLEALVRFHARAGLRHLLCTDIARDGMLSGTNLALYALLRQWAPGISMQASGGARDAGDVRATRAAGCAGIVLGKALLEGRLDLAQALSC